MSDLRTVVVTGANRGIGLALVRSWLDDEGWFVHACCRDPDGADELRAWGEQQPGRLQVHGLDVSDEASVAALGGTLSGARLDLLVNNAATTDSSGGDLWSVDVTEWATVFRTNVIGPALLTRSLIAPLERAAPSFVVNVGSKQGSVSLDSSGGRYPYRTSKAALNMLTKNLSLDLAERGVGVVAVNPGWVRTRLGGPGAPSDVVEAARSIRAVVDVLRPEHSGTFLDVDGAVVPW